MNSVLYLRSGMKQLIADSPAFQARVGAVGNAELAKSKIYQHEGKIEDMLDPNIDLGLQRPFAIVNIVEAGFTQFGQGAGNILGQYGSALVQFQDIPLQGEGVTTEQQIEDFETFIGDMIDWIACKVGRDQPDGNPDTSVTYYPFRDVRMESPIQRPDVAQRNTEDFFWTNWLFRSQVTTG